MSTPLFLSLVSSNKLISGYRLLTTPGLGLSSGRLKSHPDVSYVNWVNGQTSYVCRKVVNSRVVF